MRQGKGLDPPLQREGSPDCAHHGVLPTQRHQLAEAVHRLFSTAIRWTYTDESQGHAGGRGYVIAGEHELWWSPRTPVEQPNWRSKVVIGREFFDEITRSAIPVDVRALRLLKRSPLALDIYVWLTYRMSYLRRSCLIPWSALSRQFGADYAHGRDFRRSFVNQLGAVIRVYPAARVTETKDGLLLNPSSSHVPARRNQDGLRDCRGDS